MSFLFTQPMSLSEKSEKLTNNILTKVKSCCQIQQQQINENVRMWLCHNYVDD